MTSPVATSVQRCEGSRSSSEREAGVKILSKLSLGKAETLVGVGIEVGVGDGRGRGVGVLVDAVTG